MIPDKKVVANKQDADFAYEAALLKRIRELLPTFQKMLRKKKKCPISWKTNQTNAFQINFVSYKEGIVKTS